MIMVFSAMSQKKVTKPLPACKAILLCENVTRDKGTQKTDIKGIFDTFWLPSFPGPTLPCKIFLLLADAVGTYSITAEVHNPERGLVLFRSPVAGSFGADGKSTGGELWFPVGS